MPIPKYTNGTKTVLAGKITDVSPYPQVNGALTIKFCDSDSANLNPSFSALHSPTAGDWFVINDDYNGAVIMTDADFTKEFSEVQS